MIDIKKLLPSLNAQIHNLVYENNCCVISGLPGSTKSLVIGLLSEKNNQVIILLPGEKEVQETAVELHLLGIGHEIVAVTDYSMQSLQETLSNLSKKTKFVLVATYQLLLTPVPPLKDITASLTTLESGTSTSYDEVIDYFKLLFYQKQRFVEEPGDYSQRGAIIDFWSYSEKFPARVEFDGDFIESIRYFDAETQRSIEPVPKATIASRIDAAESVVYGQTNILEYLESPLFLLNEADMRRISPGEYAAKPPAPVSKKTKVIDEDYDIPPDPEEEIPVDIIEQTEDSCYDYFNANFANQPGTSWLIEGMFASDRNKTELKLNPAPTVGANYKILFSVITEQIGRGNTLYIAVENELQLTRYSDMLNDKETGMAEFSDSGKLKLMSLPIREGFINRQDNIVVLTDYQIFNKPYRTKLPQKLKKLSKSRKLDAIRPGDFVVHEDFGIGKFAGLEEIMIGETRQESMKIIYSQGAIVFLNINYLHLVKKFSAKDGLTPTLATLGSGEWVNKKTKAKKKIKEAARELIELYARRKMSKGFSFSQDGVWQQELEASFMYEDTPDQAKVIEEVKTDMMALHPMDRLVCGDVGFGKTEIAVRAAFKAVQDGVQVAVLAPTTILVEQHFNTFRDRLSQFPVCIRALSRFQTKAEQKQIVQEISLGKVDIVIGTHRLLSADVQFKNLGLLIIDEEHRFGVAAKEKLRSFKTNVDILTLTATPIPRTLNLSLLGARDLSIIATPPPNRQPIYTRVESFETAKIRVWIDAEIKRGGQLYIVHDRVQTIAKFAAYINRLAPDVKIGVAHGQMKPAELENVFHGFLHRKFDILLATKIIESGLDIPNVNTIIINRADRFGLSELHQLRGRVGRSDKQAYAYLLVPSVDSLNKNTIRRLQAIEEFSDIGSGFSLSMRDLEIRGAGNLLGTEQTGFIDEIGFDLYIKLINESVEELRYEEFKDVFKDLPAVRKKSNTSIESHFEIGIPNAYIPEQIDRLSYYTALYAINNIEELAEIREEMLDRFGQIPDLVQRLFTSAELKHYASLALFERIVIQQHQVIITLPKGDDISAYYEQKFPKLAAYIMENFRAQIAIQQSSHSVKLTLRKSFEKPEKAIEFLLAFAKNVEVLMRDV